MERGKRDMCGEGMPEICVGERERGGREICVERETRGNAIKEGQFITHSMCTRAPQFRNKQQKQNHESVC